MNQFAYGKEAENQSNKIRVGVVTSGGDCSGLNSIIYALYKYASQHNIEIIGFKRGQQGIINKDYIILTNNECTPMLLNQSGSILKCGTKGMTKNGKIITPDEANTEIVKTYKELNLSALVFVGGNGSTKILKKIINKANDLNMNFNAIALPKTIDNDVANTDNAIGFDTAIETATREVSDFISTIETHERVGVVEVMGRAAGYIALHVGLATGADAILIPERDYDLNALCEKIQNAYNEKKYALIIVSEAVPFANEAFDVKQSGDMARVQYGGTAKKISNYLKNRGFEAKSLVLGHTQRAGITSVYDRNLAQALAIKCLKLLSNNQKNVLLGISGNEIIATSFDEIKNTSRALTPDDTMIKTAEGLGIYLGDIKE